ANEASVPSTSAMPVATEATTTEFTNASCMAGFVSAFPHHSSEKPGIGQPETLPELKEFMMMTSNGMYINPSTTSVMIDSAILVLRLRRSMIDSCRLEAVQGASATHGSEVDDHEHDRHK